MKQLSEKKTPLHFSYGSGQVFALVKQRLWFDPRPLWYAKESLGKIIKPCGEIQWGWYCHYCANMSVRMNVETGRHSLISPYSSPYLPEYTQCMITPGSSAGMGPASYHCLCRTLQSCILPLRIDLLSCQLSLIKYTDSASSRGHIAATDVLEVHISSVITKQWGKKRRLVVLPKRSALPWKQMWLWFSLPVDWSPLWISSSSSNNRAHLSSITIPTSLLL